MGDSLLQGQFFTLNIDRLIAWLLKVVWGMDSPDYEVLDFTTIPHSVIVSYSHLNCSLSNFMNMVYSNVIILCFW